MSPICDNTRLVFGIIATLSGMVFAGMTGILKNDIRNLYRHLFQRARQASAPKSSPRNRKFSRIFGWFLLILSFGTTVFLGSYVAAVPSKTCVKVVISELVCNPPGDEVEGEFVTLQNLGDSGVNLNNWALCDYQNNHCYIFKTITIQPGSKLTIWTKVGTYSGPDLYFGSSMPIWNNEMDTAYLYDVKNQLIHQLPCPK